MKNRFILIACGVVALAFPAASFAQTNCDDQAKPALDCPTGYSMMCIPTGGDHWGCGKQNADGTFEEAVMIAPATEGSLTTTTAAPPPEQTAPAGTAPSTSEPSPATSSETGTVSQESPSQTAVNDPAPEPSAPPTPPLPPSAPAPAPALAADSSLAVDGTDPGSATPTVGAPADAGLQDVALTAAPETSSLDDLGEAADLLAENAPSWLKPVMAAIASTLAAVIAFLGIWEWLKRLREKKTKKCGRCGGDKTEAKKEPCATCGGKRTIEEEYEVKVKCAHCAGSGIDPCHHCSGTGKMSMPNPPQSKEELEGWPPCDFCGGSGKKKLGAGRDWGEANDAMKGDFACCFCHGKKEETVKMKREVPCPTCAK